ncbi:MAG: glutamate--tRNA ligase [Chloroflexi bacterium]|nr:glutamate--tRNA ligase [Chloroflexota bacterium]
MTKSERPIRVRIAPSPTGPLHIGTARSTLFNYLFARRTGGTFILRLEDTDAARSSIAYEKDILDGLHWLGLTWDEGPEVAGEAARGLFGPYRQSQRMPRYAEVAARLLAADRAYPCYCTAEELEAERAQAEAEHRPPRYSGRCANLTPAERAAFQAEGRAAALRFRVGEGIVAFDDIIRGHVEIGTDALGGDFVIVRADGGPLFHFTNVVDDIAMKISHVIRGEDHLSNTPKHILLFRALGEPIPQFAHLPLILNPDRTKMSKRRSQTAVGDYIAQGFIREALVNYLALLGWASGTEEEIFTLDELVERFDLETVHKAGAVFDRERLEWLNGQWIRRIPPDELVERLRPFLEAEAVAGRIDRMPGDDEIRSLVPMVRERLPLLGAIGDLVGFLFQDEVSLDPASLVPKRWDAATAAEALRAARAVIADVGRVSYEADEIEPPLRRLAEERGWKPGDLFMAIRVAATGRTATPPLFDTLVALGYERTLHRLDRAIAALPAQGAAATA